MVNRIILHIYPTVASTNAKLVLVNSAFPSLQVIQVSHSCLASAVSKVKQHASKSMQGRCPPPVPPRKSVAQVEKEMKQLDEEIGMLSVKASQCKHRVCSGAPA